MTFSPFLDHPDSRVFDLGITGQGCLVWGLMIGERYANQSGMRGHWRVSWRLTGVDPQRGDGDGGYGVVLGLAQFRLFPTCQTLTKEPLTLLCFAHWGRELQRLRHLPQPLRPRVFGSVL